LSAIVCSGVWISILVKADAPKRKNEFWMTSYPSFILGSVFGFDNTMDDTYPDSQSNLPIRASRVHSNGFPSSITLPTTTNFMVWNVTKEGVRTRMAVPNREAYPTPPQHWTQIRDELRCLAGVVKSG